MSEFERAVLDTTVVLERHRRWMAQQPWSGNPVMPPERIEARKVERVLEYAQRDAIDALLDQLENTNG
jgi:hypothetical protein